MNKLMIKLNNKLTIIFLLFIITFLVIFLIPNTFFKFEIILQEIVVIYNKFFITFIEIINNNSEYSINIITNIIQEISEILHHSVTQN